MLRFKWDRGLFLIGQKRFQRRLVFEHPVADGIHARQTGAAVVMIWPISPRPVHACSQAWVCSSLPGEIMRAMMLGNAAAASILLKPSAASF